MVKPVACLISKRAHLALALRLRVYEMVWPSSLVLPVPTTVKAQRAIRTMLYSLAAQPIGRPQQDRRKERTMTFRDATPIRLHFLT